MFHLQDKDNSSNFIDNVEFGDIINLYTFDKKLRGIFLEYLERIEVSFRTRILNTYSVLHGFYWYLDSSNFIDNRDSSILDDEDVRSYQGYVIKSIEKDFEDPKEQFLRKFKSTYIDSLPPENMAFETLSFGKIVKLYSCLKNTDQKNGIALDFRLPSGKLLSNWLQFLNDVRHVCAHHSRLWNRRFTANKLIF